MEYLIRFAPDPLFLFVAAGFEGVVLAIFVPVSLDIVSKTSAKYNSDVIVRLYNQSFIHRIFPYFLLLSIAGMLATRFFMTMELNVSVVGRIVMWALLLSTMIIIGMLGYLIYRMGRFVSDDGFPLKMLYTDLKRSLQLSNLISAQRVLIETLGGIGDILTYQTRRQNNLAILEGMSKIYDTLSRLLELKKTNPERFFNLVYDPEFREYMRNTTDNPQERARLCFISPGKNLAGFVVPAHQLIRIYISALNSSNSEVARKSLSYIHLVFQSCVVEKGNYLLVEWMLKRLNECSNLAMRSGEEADRLAFNWYKDILFKEPHLGTGAFRLDYLELCERYFSELLATMVARGYDTYYRNLVDSIARDFVFPNYQRGKLWGYYYLLRISNYKAYQKINLEHRLQHKVRKLLLTEHMIQTTEGLDAWKQEFLEIKKVLTPELQDTYKREAARLEKSILSYVTAYMKYKRMMRLFYALGAYCDLREKYDWMYYLWEAGQTGEGTYRILPPSPQVLINDYLTYPQSLSKNYFGSSHQVMSVYRKRYYLLLLAWLLTDYKTADYKLPPLSLNLLRDFPARIDELIELNGQLREEAYQRLRILWRLGFSGFKNMDDWQKRVKDYLLLVKKMAQKQVTIRQRTTEVSLKKKEEFRDAVMQGYKDQAGLREIFSKYTKTYEDRTGSSTKRIPKESYGLRELVNKDIFLQTRQLTSAAWNYGKSLADSENLFIVDKIQGACKLFPIKNFELALERAGRLEDVFILSTMFTMENFLAASENFRARDMMDLNIEGKQQENEGEIRNISSFAGVYHLGEHSLPVFMFQHRGSGNQLLILNRSHLGKMIQLPVLAGGKMRKSPQLLENVFYFDMQSLSKNPSLLKQYIDVKAEWLMQQGDEAEQKEYLLKRSLMIFQQNLGFHKAKDFIGFKILVPPRESEEESLLGFSI